MTQINNSPDLTRGVHSRKCVEPVFMNKFFNYMNKSIKNAMHSTQSCQIPREVVKSPICYFKVQGAPQILKLDFKTQTRKPKHKLEEMLNFKTQRRIQNTKQQNANQETKPKGTPKTVRDTFWTKTGGGFD